ncbi:MAG: hypothetical protein HQK57_11460 [Deltaproteobacteria bacterium]|nr:hypothetical protein [Deltaproteobacteria bacterium]
MSRRHFFLVISLAMLVLMLALTGGCIQTETEASDKTVTRRDVDKGHVPDGASSVKFFRPVSTK